MMSRDMTTKTAELLEIEPIDCAEAVAVNEHQADRCDPTSCPVYEVAPRREPTGLPPSIDHAAGVRLALQAFGRRVRNGRYREPRRPRNGYAGPGQN